MGSDGRFRFSVLSGPNAGKTVTCRPPVLVVLPGNCPGTGLASFVDNSSATMYLRSDRARVDVVQVHVDTDGDGTVDAGESTSTVQRRWYDPVAYGALGDSYSAGDGVRPYVRPGTPRANLLSDASHCSRSERAYPQLIGTADAAPGGRFSRLASQGYGSLSFIACTGAITPNVITSPIGPLLPDVQEFTFDNTFVDGFQLDLLAGTAGPRQDVDLVTLTIGGNDALFAPLLTFCAQANTCESQVADFSGGQPLGTWISGRLALVEERLTGTMQPVRAATAGDSTVVLVGYPRIFEYRGSQDRVFCPLSASLFGDDAVFLDRIAGDLNTSMARAARRAGVHFIDPSATFAGHGVCTGTPYIYGANPILIRTGGGLLDWSVGPGDGAYHPNQVGHRKGYAAAIRTWVNDRWTAGSYLTRTGLPANPTPTGPGPDPGLVLPRAGSIAALAEESTVADSTGAAPTAAALATVEAEADWGWAGYAVAGAPSGSCDVIAAGASFDLAADGFTPGSSVTLTLAGATVTTLTADPQGRVTFPRTAPASAPADGVAQAYRFTGTRTTTAGTVPVIRVAPVVVYPDWLPCDVTAPTITVTSPGPPATSTVGDALTIAYTCADVGSGGAAQPAAACEGDLASGDRLDTSRVGTFTVDLFAADAAGNTTTSQVTHTVTAGTPLLVVTDPATAGLMGALSQAILRDLDTDPLTPRTPAFTVATPSIGGTGALTIRGCTNPTPATTADALLALAGQPYTATTGPAPALTPACRPDSVTTTGGRP